MRRNRLDQEERKILDAIERGAWELVKPNKAQLLHYAQIARNTLRKDRRMNIRLSKADMERIRAKAAEQGIPYQTLVASILHRYVSGQTIVP